VDILTLNKVSNTIKGFCVVVDAQHLPFRSQVFDVISAFDVLEHLPNPKCYIKEVHRCLKEGGISFSRLPQNQALI